MTKLDQLFKNGYRGEKYVVYFVRTILKSHQKDFSKLGVHGLAIFGSFARKEENKNSDVAILVDFDARKGIFVF